MATENQIWSSRTFVAGADLSGSDTGSESYQFRFVELGTSGKVTVCNNAGDRPIGVLGNRPKADDAALVHCGGFVKVRAGGTIALGGNISTDANGDAVTSTTSNHYIVGRAMEAGTDGQIIQIMLNTTVASQA